MCDYCENLIYKKKKNSKLVLLFLYMKLYFVLSWILYVLCASITDLHIYI